MPLNPESSPYYTYSTKVVDGSWARFPGSVILQKPSTNSEDYKLKIAYRKYQTTKKAPETENKSPINIVFLHGNGMNKGLWHYHIDKVYQQYNNSLPNAYINTVVAVDHANQGDSAVYNFEKLGNVYNWLDGAKDVVTIVKNHESPSFSQQNAYNIIVGHSMGGFQALMTGFYEPNLFHAVLAINPVWYQEHAHVELTKYAYTKWFNTNRVISKFKFDGPNKNWKQDVIKWYKTKSFFKYFNEQVLLNMIEDDIPEKFDINKPYEEVHLKHDGIQEYITYFSGRFAYTPSLPLYNLIKVPVYHVYSEYDIATLEGVQVTRDLLKDVVIPIDIPKLQHSMNAEQPDLTLDIIYRVINEITAKPPQKSINDFEYKNKLGDDYKLKLINEKFEDNILESFTPLKGRL